MPFKKPHQTAEPNPDEYNKLTDVTKTICKIKPKGFNIIWGNDPRYWKVTDDCAELIQVSWLEVSGKVNVEEGKTYIVKFHVEVKEDGFGWGGTDVLVMAKVGKKGKYEYQAVKLDYDKNKTYPEVKELEIKVPSGEKELHFGLYEVWSGKWKGGLKIYKAEVVKKPSNYLL